MSDGMGREFTYLSSHATNRYFIPNWGMYSAKRRMAVFCTSPILANTLSDCSLTSYPICVRHFVYSPQSKYGILAKRKYNHWLSLPYFGGSLLVHLSIHAVAQPWRQQPSLFRRYNGHHSRCPLCLCGSHQCEGA